MSEAATLLLIGVLMIVEALRPLFTEQDLTDRSDFYRWMARQPLPRLLLMSALLGVGWRLVVAGAALMAWRAGL